MTLTAHGVTGAALATAFVAHPALGCTLALLSHYVLDAIPHWDMTLTAHSTDQGRAGEPFKFDRALVRDLALISFDGLLGVFISLALFAAHAPWFLIVCGAGFGMLPDALQFVYMRYPRWPLPLIQRFHDACHTSTHISRHVIGIGLQAVFVLAVSYTCLQSLA